MKRRSESNIYRPSREDRLVLSAFNSSDWMTGYELHVRIQTMQDIPRRWFDLRSKRPMSAADVYVALIHLERAGYVDSLPPKDAMRDATQYRRRSLLDRIFEVPA